VVAIELAVLAAPRLASRPVLGVVLLAGALIAAGAAAAGERIGRVPLIVVAVPAGAAALGLGIATAVTEVALGGRTVGDVVGVAGAIAGAVLLVSAIRAVTAGRRRALQVAIVAGAALVVAQWVVWPALGAGLASHTGRPSIPPAAALGAPGARDVTFASRDGTMLAGWYVPSRNGAVVLLLHGSHGTRADTAAHLRMLARAGFGVLAFDARGHGRSRGTTNALGWHGTDDVAGAYAFARRQPGVDPHRVAALGLSMGAEEALRGAADGVPLAAVVADGAGASTLSDQRLLADGPTTPVFVSGTWLMMRTTELVTGDREPPGLHTIAGRVHAPVLLIAAGSGDEATIDRVLAHQIGRTASLWLLADTAHTRGLATHPAAYAERTLGFLRAATAP
jgi:dienelactone hydrolase